MSNLRKLWYLYKVIKQQWLKTSELEEIQRKKLRRLIIKHVYEKMACGTPLIASRVGAVPDIIENDKTGIIVEPKDVEGLKRALVRLIEDQELAREMSERGRERIENYFTWDAVCRKLERFYKDIVERNNKMEVEG